MWQALDKHIHKVDVESVPWDFPSSLGVKNLLCNAGDTSLIPGLGRPYMPRSH